MGLVTEKQAAVINGIAAELGLSSLTDATRLKILQIVTIVGWREAVRLIAIEGRTPEEVILEYGIKPVEVKESTNGSRENQAKYLKLVGEMKRGSKASKGKIASVLATTTCEVLANHVIHSSSEAEPPFDPYYLEKHEVAKRSFIDCLKSKLIRSNANFQIQLEEGGELGRYDVVVTVRSADRKAERLIVEIKAGLRLDLSQIERYMMAGEKLLLVRIMTRHVKLFNPPEFNDMLERNSRILAEKAQRIIEDRALLLPGTECYQCPVKGCQYNRTKEEQRRGLIHQTQRDFEEDASNFLKNLYPTVDAAVQLAMESLNLSEKPAEKTGT